MLKIDIEYATTIQLMSDLEYKSLISVDIQLPSACWFELSGFTMRQYTDLMQNYTGQYVNFVTLDEFRRNNG